MRQDSTDAERQLWSALRDRRLRGHRFHRHRPIGEFIADLSGTRHRLVFEADGGQHSDNEADGSRTAWLEAEGWRVMRFWNNEVLANTEGVIETILREVSSS